MVLSGRCLCGTVTYAVDGEVRDVWNCHCHRCRRFTGHHMAGTRADLSAVTIVGDTLTWYAPDGSAAYGFCSACGSSMFWRCVERPLYLTICAGTLDQPTGLKTTTAWWTAEHADYHTPTPHLIEHEYDG